MTHEEEIVKIATLENQMSTALAGVSNFREFQRRMERHMGFQRGAVWICGGVFTIFLLLVSWMLSNIAPAAKIILDDYYRNHPAARIQPKKESENMKMQYNAGIVDEDTSAGQRMPRIAAGKEWTWQTNSIPMNLPR
jgi:hypothetical protein